MPGRTKQAIDLARKTRLQLEEENVKLAAENERLRSALKEVIECDPGAYEAAIARAALEGKHD
jgi:regulator of replication initiation timing